jgi:hypothetical protein
MALSMTQSFDVELRPPPPMDGRLAKNRDPAASTWTSRQRKPVPEAANMAAFWLSYSVCIHQ